jgi:CheY-like chemotaxis protein
LFDPGVVETLIQIRKHERVISAMDIFWAEILWVDPKAEELSALQLRLENEDFHVVVAKSVQEALDYLRRKSVALVLSEHRFDGKDDGFGLLYALKNDPTLSHIPFVFHASAETADIRQALELGAEDWFQKPSNVEIVAMKVKKILSRVRITPTANTDGVQGNIRDMGMIEMIQILSSANRSVHIVLDNQKSRAEIVMQHGKVIAAVYGDLLGEDAAIEILLLEEGRFRILPLKTPPAANVTMSTDNLVMQSCFQKDTRANLKAA